MKLLASIALAVALATAAANAQQGPGPGPAPAAAPTYANPSATVGTSVVNGSATSAMRSDAAPAINQTMSPSMTGAWSFQGGVAVSSGLNADNASQLVINGTEAATGAAGRALGITTVFAPNGASNIAAVNISPHLGLANGVNIANFEGIFISALTIDSGYLGTIPSITGVECCVFVNNGNAGVPPAIFAAYYVDPMTNGNAITTGATNNVGFDAVAPTAAAGAGGTVTNADFLAAMGSGSSAGTTNYGLHIIGNGGASSINYAIYSASTAGSVFSGPLTVTSAPLLLNGNISAASPTTGGFGLTGVGVTYTDTTGSGTVANEAANAFGQPTIAATNASTTITNLDTLFLPAPVAGTNVTATNLWSLYSNGASRFIGNISGANGISVLGAAINFNASSNFATNLNTGTSTGTLTLGGASATVNFGGITGSTQCLHVNTSGTVTGAGADCGTAAGANPTGTIGLSAVNGSSTSFMRADAAPALGVGIVPTWTGEHTFNAAGAASTSSVLFNGTLFTGGSGTTTFPNIFVGAGSAPTTWSTSGTYLGFDGASGFGGNYIDIHTNGGGSIFLVGSTGGVTASATITSSGSLTAGSAQSVSWSSRGILTSPAAGQIQLGAADAASPVAQTLSAQSVVAGTSNTAGAATTVTGSLSTGSGTSGDIVIKTGGTGAGATVQNSAVTALTIKGATQEVITGSNGTASTPSLAITGANGGLYSANGNTLSLSANNAQGMQVDGSGVEMPSGDYLGWCNSSPCIGNGDDTPMYRGGAAFIQLGKGAPAVGSTGSATAFTIGGGGSTNNNTAGANLTIYPAPSTGSGTSGDLLLETGGTGAAAGSLNTPVAGITIKGATQAVLMPGLASSSAATTGTVCWTTGGNLTVDTTLACLSSTRKIKQNIVPLTDGLAEIERLQPVAYDLRPEFNPKHLGRQVGLVAEDVQKVDPRLVGLDANGEVEGVRYMQLTALLVKAVQEQQVEIDSLKAQLKMERVWAKWGPIRDCHNYGQGTAVCFENAIFNENECPMPLVHARYANYCPVLPVNQTIEATNP